MSPRASRSTETTKTSTMLRQNSTSPVSHKDCGIATGVRSGVIERVDNATESATITNTHQVSGNANTAMTATENRSRTARQIGRASCRERVDKYVKIPVVAESLKKKTQNKT